MPAVTITTVVKSNRANSLKNLIGNPVAKTILRTLQTVQEEARLRAPHDTGALAASIYVSTPEFSDYAECAAEAQALRPGVEPEPEERTMEELSGNVGSCSPYASYVEFGTERAPAQPFLTPASDTIQQTYLEVAVPVLNEFLETEG
jgi:HK97 gp10 family phage protein